MGFLRVISIVFLNFIFTGLIRSLNIIFQVSLLTNMFLIFIKTWLSVSFSSCRYFVIIKYLPILRTSMGTFLIFKSFINIHVRACMINFDLLSLTTSTIIFRYFKYIIEIFIYNFKGLVLISTLISFCKIVLYTNIEKSSKITCIYLRRPKKSILDLGVRK